MNRLILMRHAKTEPWHEGVDDHARALIERGQSDAALIGRALSERGWQPDFALVSTARRARETWKCIAADWGDLPVTLDDSLYLAAPQILEAALSADVLGGTVILIAHNPGLHEFACLLSRRGPVGDTYAQERLFEKFPTGCVALFEADAAPETAFHPSVFRLAGLIRPSDLRICEDEQDA
ncbi:MAG: histidine phosphatase family protein [Hyphomonadaceae bacterium]|nr:histidine phosphatase family protein [Hyphomonadaceae bacterium]